MAGYSTVQYRERYTEKAHFYIEMSLFRWLYIGRLLADQIFKINSLIISNDLVEQVENYRVA